MDGGTLAGLKMVHIADKRDLKDIPVAIIFFGVSRGVRNFLTVTDTLEAPREPLRRYDISLESQASREIQL